MVYHFGLIGYPISYSLSPFIHKQFFEKLNIEGEYSIIDIHPDSEFSEAMASLKSMDLDGFNITIPYKQKILPYLDEIDQSAQDIGAVNTVLNKAGKWIGYNTDGTGYVRALQEHYPHLVESLNLNILILGAGGAAKGIYHGLKAAGYTNITIANRTVEKALSITNDKKIVLSLDDAENKLDMYDLVIQTTSVGMKPQTHETIIDISGIKPNTIVSDIVYQPILTQFLKEAQKQDAQIHLGHTMLLYQAQLAFEIWTEKLPEMNGISAALQSILEG